MVSDEELVAGISRGDSKSFEELIERYSRKAYGLAFRLVGNAEDAEEALQDVFTQVHRKAGEFQGKSQFSSWLYRVTVNSCLMKLRKRKQEKAQPLEDVLPSYRNTMSLRQDEREEGDRATFIFELKTALEEAIQTLPEEYKPVFILRDVDGLSSSEVGTLLGISIPAVKSRLHRSRMILREKLLPIYEEIADGARPELKATGTE